MFGILLTNEREYIIIILLIYLIYNTEEIPLQIVLLILLITHIYKLYSNYQLNKDIYKDKIKPFIYNIILFSVFILYVLYPNNNYLLLLSLSYVITSILIHKTLIDDSNYKLHYSKPVINHKFTILTFLIIIILYQDHKYLYLIWADLINHLLTLLLF